MIGKGIADIKKEEFSFKFDENSQEKDSLNILVGNKKISPAEILKHLKKLLKPN